MIVKHQWRNFLPKILNLTFNRALKKADLLTNEFLIARENELEMYYAPHNDYINQDARIIIVGITPGWQQMKKAYEQTIKGLNHLNKSHKPMRLDTKGRVDISLTLSQEDNLLHDTKVASRFTGTMRNHLIAMLDECGLAKIFGFASTSDLFEQETHLLHTTSLIKYPVFYKGKNYTGHTPRLNRSDLLLSYAKEVFPWELRQIPQATLIIPLGKVVDQMLQPLFQKDEWAHTTYLTGFPHPSGANAHRYEQFADQQKNLKKLIQQWKNQSF